MTVPRGETAIESERRQWERLPLAIPIFVRGKDRAGRKFFDLTVVQNIGAGGLAFASHRALPRSATLLFEVPSAPWIRNLRVSDTVRQLKGRVVRFVAKDKHSLYAVQFNRPLI